MLIDTHCHIHNMVKKDFDVPLTPTEIDQSHQIVQLAYENGVTTIITIGTSLIESKNAIALAQTNRFVWSAIGIHPNDCTADWKNDFKEITRLARDIELNKIVAIGECGLDMHYPQYNLQRQKDAFKAHIELALERSLALVVHTRDAAQETLYVLEEFKRDLQSRTVIHCFSENIDFANTVINWGFYIGIGGAVTYPKNNRLRDVVTHVPLESIVLETDAPFLPIQAMRGKQNHPRYIKEIAEYVAQLRGQSFDSIAQQTTCNSRSLFKLLDRSGALQSPEKQEL